MAGNCLVCWASSWLLYKKLSAVIYLFHFGAYFCCLGFNLRLVNHGFWGNSNGTWTRQYVLHNLHPIYKRHKEKKMSTKSDYYINFDWWTFTTLITRVCFHSILTLSGTVFCSKLESNAIPHSMTSGLNKIASQFQKTRDKVSSQPNNHTWQENLVCLATISCSYWGFTKILRRFCPFFFFNVLFW